MTSAATPSPTRSRSAPETVPAALDAFCAVDGTVPFVTFYDDATGERVELSRATFVNWVAKTAGLLVDDLEVEAGDPIGVDLPPHWLALVWAAAGWSVGAILVDAADADVVLTGPEFGARGRRCTAATALLPLGGRFDTALPEGVLDFGVEVYSHPDAFVTAMPPTPDSPAAEGLTQRDLLGEPIDDRILTTDDLLTPDLLGTYGGLLSGRGSLVLCRHTDDERLVALAATEGVDRRLDRPRDTAS